MNHFQLCYKVGKDQDGKRLDICDHNLNLYCKFVNMIEEEVYHFDLLEHKYI